MTMNKMSGNPSPHSLSPLPTWLRALRAIGITIVWSIIALLTLWAVAALYVDFRIACMARSGDSDLRSRDRRDPIQVQTILLDCQSCVSQASVVCWPGGSR